MNWGRSLNEAYSTDPAPNSSPRGSFQESPQPASRTSAATLPHRRGRPQQRMKRTGVGFVIEWLRPILVYPPADSGSIENMGLLRTLVSTSKKVIFAAVLLLLYLEVYLIITIVRESGEYAHIVLWFELGTAIAGGLIIWRYWEKPLFQGLEFSKIGTLLKLWGRIKAVCKIVLNYQKLIAGVLLIFPGLITDTIGVLLMLKAVLSPTAPLLGTLHKKLGTQGKIKRLASHAETLSELGLPLAEKGRGLFAKVGPRIPNRASMLSGPALDSEQTIQHPETQMGHELPEEEEMNTRPVANRKTEAIKTGAMAGTTHGNRVRYKMD